MGAEDRITALENEVANLRGRLNALEARSPGRYPVDPDNPWVAPDAPDPEDPED